MQHNSGRCSARYAHSKGHTLKGHWNTCWTQEENTPDLNTMLLWTCKPNIISLHEARSQQSPLPCGFQGLPPDVVSAMTRHSQVGGTPGTCFCWNLYVPEISGIKWRASTPAFSDSLNWVVHRLNNKTSKHLVKIYCQTTKLAKLADAILELLVVSCLFKICISFPSKNKTGSVNACRLY